MKKFFYNSLIAIATMVLVTSCGKSTEHEGLIVKSTTIEGELAEYFQLVDKEYNLDDNELTVEVKRIKEGLPRPWRETAKPEDISIKFELTVSSGKKTIGKADKDLTEKPDQTAKLVDLPVGKTQKLTFTNIDDDVMPGDKISLAASFKMLRYIVTLKGRIGSSMNVTMALIVNKDGKVKGAYHYNRYSPKHLLFLSGKMRGQNLELSEFNANGLWTGDYRTTYSNGVLTGSMTNSRYNTYAVQLNDGEADFDIESVYIPEF